MILLAGGGLALLAATLLLAPWWWAGFRQRGLSRRRANVAAYRQRLAELAAEERAGTIDAGRRAALEQELAARLLADADGAEPAEATARGRAVPAIAAVALIAFAGTWYVLAGSWRVSQLIELGRSDPEAARAESLARSMRELEQRVAADPRDREAWAWLGRVRFDRGDYAAAADAYASASGLAGGQDPELLAARGEALAYARGQQLAGEPAALFAQALALAPDHEQSLWYAGLAALQAGDRAVARRHWSRLLQLPLPEQTRTALEQALQDIGGAGPAHPAPQPPSLTVDVALDPSLRAGLSGSETVFVFAVEPGGPPMPLAARRLRVDQLPARVVLTDADAMMPSRKLSQFSRWTLRARVSSSGEPAPRPGDLEGERTVTAAEAGKPVSLGIDRRIAAKME